MNKKYSLMENGSFLIKDYNQMYPFSNFLPGVAGEKGIPLWVFYVNRGQGVVSFGIKDKDHSILEFFPANKAYTLASTFGFRTFIKVNGIKYYEPFKVISENKREEEMLIKSEGFEIKEVALDTGLEVSVRYFTLPNTHVGGLVRIMTVKNISQKNLNLEGLDGLSRIIPFGSINLFLKDMSRTLEAWMHSSVLDDIALFRLIVDPRDVSHTKYIDGANFNYSFYTDKKGKIIPYKIVDPTAVFAQDTSFSTPVNFYSNKFKTPLNQINCGRTPCCFNHFKWDIKPGQEQTLYSIYGASFKQDSIKELVNNVDEDYLEEKECENHRVIDSIKNNAYCVSGSVQFDNYVKNTYLDNVLRGGYPYSPDKDGNLSEKSGTYYIFSRKHGDLERDYNFFQLSPSYFSEGEANYRDINQNRRMDLFFNPALGYQNVIYFFNFLKIDGYNPLVVKGEKLYFEKEQAQLLLSEWGIKDQKLSHHMVKGFYLGEFFALLEEEKSKVKNIKKLILKILDTAKREPQASHGEGYWIDHWHYNLDLIESFLYFYPDRLKELFLSNVFSFWDDEHRVKDRKERYVFRGGNVYQGESVEIVKEKKTDIKQRVKTKNFLRAKDGEVYKTNLICKLLTLILNKSATLDPDGVGIEMEAGKPGWCDSLNGLPALFGSSLSETLELKRTVTILLSVFEYLIRQGIKEIALPIEVLKFLNKLNKTLIEFLKSESLDKDYIYWDKSNSIKEEFRKNTFFCIEGEEEKISLINLEYFLKNLILKLNQGIKKAKDKKSGLPVTYFTFKSTEYIHNGKDIWPTAFKRKALPLSLEGVVHALRVEGKKSIHQNLVKSDLFDKALKMYRLNASYKDESLEIGRSRVFVPGWLENESIWLHMEYKYLLELLKKGFYEEFFVDFYNCIVCFFDAKKYGRNVLENSSFIVSSAFPDKSIWGKGFVARLSGATAELINIWIILCLGREPFYIDKNNDFCIRFSPVINKKLFTKKKQNISFKGKDITLEKNVFAFRLFSKTLVVYHNPNLKDTYSKESSIVKVKIAFADREVFFESGVIKPPFSFKIRDRKAERIDIYLT